MEAPSIDGTFGAALIGSMITMVLYGITTLQTYLYYVYYPNDNGGTKLLVACIWSLDTVHIGFVGHCMYYYVITNYFNPVALADGVWTLYTSLAVNLLVAVLVQSYFALRIFRLSSPRVQWWLTSFIMVVVTAHFAFGMETVILMFIKKELSRLQEITLIAATPFAVCAVLSDILIAGALCVILQGHRTEFRGTNAMLTTLMIYAINRCLLTAIVAIAETIAFAVSPHSLWFIAIDFVIGKLYANSLLATLNTRHALSGKGLETERSSSQGNSVRMSHIRWGSSSGGEGRSEPWARNTGDRVISLAIKDQGASISDSERASARADVQTPSKESPDPWAV